MISRTDRVVIVTGAASGIGRAVAERVIDDGGAVVAVDRAADGLAWVEGLRARVDTVVGDVTSADTNANAVACALDRFGRLDAAVFNAGVSMSGDLLELPMEEFDRAIAVNVRAVALGIRSVVPTLRAAGQGRIVVTASTSGLGGDPNLWAYNTAKGAVVNLVRAAAVDLGADGITVNAVCPGPTETAMTERLQSLPELHEELRRTIPLQRWGRPEEIAAVIAFLTSADASFITGAIVPVDGGITANTGQFRPRAVPR
jgi:meso-butanediol dehydrogenase / (S,S)-butanediol dehydrogenase / diacetyl reductase